MVTESLTTAGFTSLILGTHEHILLNHPEIAPDTHTGSVPFTLRNLRLDAVAEFLDMENIHPNWIPVIASIIFSGIPMAAILHS